jgi:hypothetical protein
LLPGLSLTLLLLLVGSGLSRALALLRLPLLLLTRCLLCSLRLLPRTTRLPPRTARLLLAVHAAQRLNKRGAVKLGFVILTDPDWFYFRVTPAQGFVRHSFEAGQALKL